MRPSRFKQLTKRQQWESIVVRLNRYIVKFEQIIIDANYWNGLEHNQIHTPIDVEESRLMVAKLKKDLADFIRQNPPESI